MDPSAAVYPNQMMAGAVGQAPWMIGNNCDSNAQNYPTPAFMPTTPNMNDMIAMQKSLFDSSIFLSPVEDFHQQKLTSSPTRHSNELGYFTNDINNQQKSSFVNSVEVKKANTRGKGLSL